MVGSVDESSDESRLKTLWGPGLPSFSRNEVTSWSPVRAGLTACTCTDVCTRACTYVCRRTHIYGYIHTYKYKQGSELCLNGPFRKVEPF